MARTSGSDSDSNEQEYEPWVPSAWTVTHWSWPDKGYVSHLRQIGYFYTGEFEALCGLLGIDPEFYRKNGNSPAYVVPDYEVTYK